VVSARSSIHPELEVERPSGWAVTRAKRINSTTLGRALGLANWRPPVHANDLQVQSVNLIIYRFASAKRARSVPESDPPTSFPSPPLPPLPDSITEGRHYVAAEVRFILPWGHDDLAWLAVIDVQTLSVLMLRAHIDGTNGLVFPSDPITLNGGPASSAPSSALDLLRVSLPLSGLDTPVAGLVNLSGSLVSVRDLEYPTASPPTVATGTDFAYGSRTNEFAAVNAYHRFDQALRTIDSLGFPIAGYLKGTTLPTLVDHRGHMPPNPFPSSGRTINAYCMGNGAGESSAPALSSPIPPTSRTHSGSRAITE
jgi:hypothetical protein